MRSRRKKEFGDFQTPRDLANTICCFLHEQGLRPASILEPTCGRGSLLLSALDHFKSATQVVGLDINPAHIEYLQSVLATRADAAQVQVCHGDFFETNWQDMLAKLPDPLLVIGNPPWITNSELASMGSLNLPHKTNFKGLAGLDAKTGKGNLDISEWMLIHILELVEHRRATMAMLCKTSVARKVLAFAWRAGLRLGPSSIYLIDAQKVFGASVDACLLVCDTATGEEQDQTGRIFSSISQNSYESTFGHRHGRLLADVQSYERWKHLEGQDSYRWRSGIKHDCSKIMELEKRNGDYWNTLGEVYELEGACVYPMLKSFDVARESAPRPSKWMLVPQKNVGEDTAPIRHKAPKTWGYLTDHAAYLDRRKSSVYRNRPRFSIFGVGEYSFALWKVATSSLYKKLHFAVVGPYAGKPVVLDDTCYFIPCQSEKEARYLAGLLNSDVARQFFESFIFWDAKRPVTIDILDRLNLVALARELGVKDKIKGFLSARGALPAHRQLPLFG